MLDSLCDRHNLPRIPRLGVHCAMKLYAQLQAVPNEKQSDWKNFKLEEACAVSNVHLDNAHNALSDAAATFDLLSTMSIGETQSIDDIPF